MNKNKICVYAICKNEIKFVDKGLDNMSEADYIVVLDTGSTDGTFEKLKADKRVTRVEQQIINPGRFDVARNESMKLIPDDANILLSTDFDELFNAGWADIIRKYWDDSKYNRGFYKYAGSHNEVGEPTDVFIYDKMHTRDFIWKFPVHEVLVPKNDDVQVNAIDYQDYILLEHFQDNTKPRSSYMELLKLSAKENEDDPHVHMLLAREYLLNSEYEEALETYLETARMPKIDAEEMRNVLLETLGRIAQIYAYLKNYDEGIWYCQEFIKEDPTYREPYFMMASMYNEMKMYTLAEACVNEALKCCTRKYSWVERANTWVCEADDILSVAEYNLGNIDSAIEHVKVCLEHAPEDQRLLKNYLAFLQKKVEELTEKIEDGESEDDRR